MRTDTLTMMDRVHQPLRHVAYIAHKDRTLLIQDDSLPKSTVHTRTTKLLLTMTAEIHSVGELQATSTETGNIKYIFCYVSFLPPPAQVKNS